MNALVEGDDNTLAMLEVIQKEFEQTAEDLGFSLTCEVKKIEGTMFCKFKI